MKTILAKDMNQNKSSIHMTLRRANDNCVRSDIKKHRTLSKNLNYSTSLKIKAQQSSLSPPTPKVWFNQVAEQYKDKETNYPK